ncbi:MAG: PHP domain-containing protein [bacterium]|nr:PHP domain-containing protein [bacterium]
MSVDLHTHSTTSDGSHTPHELALALNLNEIKIAALTDHDTMGGCDEFLRTASEVGLTAIVGIEFSTIFHDKEVHLLGYGLPRDDSRVIKFMSEHHSYLRERASETLRKLRENGFNISLEKVYEISNGNPPMPSHIIREIYNCGYISSLVEAAGIFNEYLKFGAKAWVDHETQLLKPLNMMLEVGAVPIVAHPYRFPSLSWLEEILDLGARGFELYYPEQTGLVFEELSEFARLRGCLVTGGCDYHGAFAERKIREIEVPLEVGIKLLEVIGHEVPVELMNLMGGNG